MTINTQRLRVASDIAQFLFYIFFLTRGCIMTLEGSVDEYLSKQKTCRIPNIYEYPVTREKDD